MGAEEWYEWCFYCLIHAATSRHKIRWPQTGERARNGGFIYIGTPKKKEVLLERATGPAMYERKIVTRF